jgi:hypothetical protein
LKLLLCQSRNQAAMEAYNLSYYLLMSQGVDSLSVEKFSRIDSICHYGCDQRGILSDVSDSLLIFHSCSPPFFLDVGEHHYSRR